jgi:hypothetical protein
LNSVVPPAPSSDNPNHDNTRNSSFQNRAAEIGSHFLPNNEYRTWTFNQLRDTQGNVRE